MVKPLSLRQIGPEGEFEVATLEEGEYYLGRVPIDPDMLAPTAHSVVVESMGISRRHGVFSQIRDYWLYCDIGSTNGSCLNGVTLRRNQLRIVRPGDQLELAEVNFVIRALEEAQEEEFGEEKDQAPEPRSLVVLARGDFFSEFRVPMSGRILAAGGAKTDLPIEGEAADSLCIFIEFKSPNLCLIRGNSEIEVLVNGQPLTDTINLFDGDMIEVGDYQLLVNDPHSAPRKTEMASFPRGGDDASGKERGISQLTVFNKDRKGNFEDEKARRKTQVIFPAEFRDTDEPLRREGPATLMRQSLNQAQDVHAATSFDLSARENFVIALFAGILLVGLLIMGIYFLFV
jgi:pSer/pThr/pTyr-binding forkhead associated (FHA) protein